MSDRKAGFVVLLYIAVLIIVGLTVRALFDDTQPVTYLDRTIDCARFCRE